MGRYPFIILCLLGGAKETDLIYEGIATFCALPVYFIIPKETDLIYEGIATLRLRGMRLRGMPKETDLIYEGIATYIGMTYQTIPWCGKKLT